MLPNTDSLYLKVKQQILTLICGLPLESRIPTRNQLTEQFGVARTTIDRAISELIGEGYLYARIGSGTYVISHGGHESASATSSIWGFLLPSVTEFNFSEMIRSAEDVCNREGINLILCNTDNDAEKQNRYIDQLLALKISGLIAVPIYCCDLETMSRFDKILQAGIKVVFCTRGIDFLPIPKVQTNDFYGAYIAVDYMLSRGYQRPAFISKRMLKAVEERYCGYLSALYTHNLALDENLVCLNASSENKSAYDFMRSFLELPEPPDSVFCFNDQTAIDVYRAIADAGLKVGKDIAVVGYDDTHACEELEPKLTSVRPPNYEIGRLASRTLLQMLKGVTISNEQPVFLKPTLIPRESC